jgi:hypothetical protein
MPFGTACCAIEFMATAASKYDLARFGMERQAFSPRQADLLICAVECPNLRPCSAASGSRCLSPAVHLDGRARRPAASSTTTRWVLIISSRWTPSRLSAAPRGAGSTHHDAPEESRERALGDKSPRHELEPDPRANPISPR